MSFPPPSLSPPELEDFQWYFNGLKFGAGTPWAVLKVEGLDMAEIRNGDVALPRDHGESRGLDLYKGRDVIFDLWTKTDGTSLQDALEQLAAATNVLPGEEPPLWFKLPNMPTLAIMCRPRKRHIVVDADYAAANVTEPELAFHATDPRIYSPGAENTIALKEPPTEPGSVAELTNGGNTESRPIVIFDGPLARPYIENDASGTPRLSFFDPTADEAEQAANVAELQAFVAGWELYPHGIPLWSVSEKYREFRYVRVVKESVVEFKILVTEDYYVAKIDNEGHEPKNEEEEFWEHVGHEFYEKPSQTFPPALKSSQVEAKEKAVRERQEAEEKEHHEAREKEEKEGLRPTVKAGDQLLVDFSIPHLILYYPGGIEANKPEDVYKWLTNTSTWWDLIPGVNPVSFSSFDEKDTGGKAVIQWASARQL